MLEICSIPQKTKQVCNEKKIFSFFVSDIISEVGFWPRAQLLDGSISLKFSLKTRLESESYEPLIDVLVFLVQKL